MVRSGDFLIDRYCLTKNPSGGVASLETLSVEESKIKFDTNGLNRAAEEAIRSAPEIYA